MCGIFGYVGKQTAAPILLEGLRTLEYRGYDSAGVYVPGHEVIKAVGPIDNLASKVRVDLGGTSGIAHTRWATHGAPTLTNAHPHQDMSGQIYLVHNGIIENYRELKEGLSVQGIKFYSDTDTEVLAKLIGSFYRGSLYEAVVHALSAVRGTYGLSVMHEKHPEEVIAARYGSPIVLGVGMSGNFISSDPSALLVHTKDVVYLDDGEIARVEADKYEVLHLERGRQKKEPERIDWDVESVKKAGFDHYMQKEIFEIPEVIENSLRGRIVAEKGRAKLGGIEAIWPNIKDRSRLEIVGCGSAYYAGLAARHWFETYAGVPTSVELGSEYRYKTHFPDNKTIALFVSQSGETADTRASLKLAKDNGLPTLGVVNVVGSAIAREIDAGVYNHAGPEVAVASTKAFVSQLSVLALLALFFGREKQLSLTDGVALADALRSLPEVLRQVLERADKVKAAAEAYAKYDNFVYLGRGPYAAIAAEGALKLKEVSYVHAEGYAGGELKHGPIAMLDENFPVFALVPKDGVYYEKMLSNIEEVKARRAPVIAITTDGDVTVSEIADTTLYVPKTHPIIQPIVTTLPLHLFAYYFGVARGLNVDRPRNLAKSVTVE